MIAPFLKVLPDVDDQGVSAHDQMFRFHVCVHFRRPPGIRLGACDNVPLPEDFAMNLLPSIESGDLKSHMSSKINLAQR